TVKCRIGIDQQDSDEALARFVLPLAEAGCDAFILHARKAWLSGLDPKANRTVPPLDYDRVLRLKRRYPALTICLNGGIRSLVAAAEFWPVLDGVMIGRAAIENPWLFAEADSQWFLGENPPGGSRHAVVMDYLPYLRREMAAGESWSRLSRPLLPLFQGQPGARWWRRHLSTTHHDAGSKTVEEALALLGLA
ncbi:MAG: tRNA-dihydrouridine synthase, partial [Pseudomonadota bacterium]